MYMKAEKYLLESLNIVLDKTSFNKSKAVVISRSSILIFVSNHTLELPSLSFSTLSKDTNPPV